MTAIDVTYAPYADQVPRIVDQLEEDQTANVLTVTTGKVVLTNGAATAALAIGLGATAAEGAQIFAIDETVSFTVAAKYKTLAATIPAGAQLLSVQANVQVLLVGGGTSVAVGLGDHTGTTNTYGFSAALTKNAKINTVPAWAPLGSPLTLDVCAAVTGGATAGDSNFTAGSVRVRVVYLVPTSLTNA